MAIMVSEVYEALAKTGAPQAKAKVAGEAIAAIEQLAPKEDNAGFKAS